MAKKTKRSASTPDTSGNREIASIANGRDITRMYTGPLLTPFDKVLAVRGQGDLQIYDQVYSDPQVKSVFAQRQLAVTKCEWTVEPASDSSVDKKAADFLATQLEKIGWDRVTNLMLFGVFYGYAVAELIYERGSQYIELKDIKVRDRKRFRFDSEGNLRLLTAAQMFEGELVEPPYFWHFAAGATHDDEPYGLGLAHWLYWPVFFKRHALKSWLTYLEKYAVPTAVGKYGRSASDLEKTKLLMAGAALGTDASIIVPEDMQLALLEASRSGVTDYRSLHDAMDSTMAKVVLGQTASSQGTPGRLGNDELQGDVRQDLIKADADLICESFNLGPARWLTTWNFPSAQPPRVRRIVGEAEDLKARAERDAAITNSTGYKPTLQYIQDTYGGEWEERSVSPPPFMMPASLNATQAIEKQAPTEKQAENATDITAKSTEKEAAKFAAPTLTTAADGADMAVARAIYAQQHLDHGVDNLPIEILDKLLSPMVAPAVRAIKAGEDVDEAMALLLDAFPEMDEEALVEHLANAMFVADLWGHLMAQKEMQ